MGHGTYRRQVLGLTGGCGGLVVWIRRFLCRGCRRTISVQPEDLYPGRWYAALAIVWSLALSLLGDEPAGKVRERVTGSSEPGGWKTLGRWQGQLLAPLWSWLSRQLGFSEPARDRAGRRQRLTRLLWLHGADVACSRDEIQDCVRRLVRGTAHVGDVGFEMPRGPPAGLVGPASLRNATVRSTQEV